MGEEGSGGFMAELRDLDAVAERLRRQALLFGQDDTPGIVSVFANKNGQATVWRRINGELLVEQDNFACWCLLAGLEYTQNLPMRVFEQPLLPEQFKALLSEVAATAGQNGNTPLGWIVPLAGDAFYRYLLLTTRMAEVERAIVANYNRIHTATARGFYEMNDLVYSRPQAEQYLMITGRTYFKDMSYNDLHRMQIDFETTGLDPDKDSIFMVSIKDSRGYERVLDTGPGGGATSEADLLDQLAAIIRERDPDVIENHNIFDFDIRFMITRARQHGLRLAMGRNEGDWSQFNDILKVGENTENFTRYSLIGREVIDTLHAVKRFNAVARDMRSHGLKESARYFGFAKPDREYIQGEHIWTTFRNDPERVRRYAMDDVEEVDDLSRLLLGSSFALASIVPKPYERIATTGTAQGLIEPLMVRAYLAEGAAVPRESTRGYFTGGRTDLFTSGVISNIVKADVASLYPSIMLLYKIGPACDRLGVFLDLLQGLTELRLHHKAALKLHAPDSREYSYHNALQGAIKVLINSFYGALGASYNMFNDIPAAARVTEHGRAILSRILLELEQRGHTLIEADTDGVYFNVPSDWSYEDELALIESVSAALPAGIHLEHDGRWAQMYSYAEKNYALRDYKGRLKVKGVAFKSSKNELYGERFFMKAIVLMMDNKMEELRQLYLDTVDRLRRREVPTAELCVLVQLSKTPEEYRLSPRTEEQYEVMKAAGKSWERGQRITYYQIRGGRKKLYDPENPQQDYDAEYYVAKLKNTYAQRLSKAVEPEAFNALFSETLDMFAPPLDAITTTIRTEKTASVAATESALADNGSAEDEE